MDDEDGVEREANRGSLQYDYFKYLTSLCIFSLGGILALADKVPSQGNGKQLLIAAVVVICLAGLSAFTGVGELVRADAAREKPKAGVLKWGGYSPLILSVGLGMFVWLFAQSLLP